MVSTAEAAEAKISDNRNARKRLLVDDMVIGVVIMLTGAKLLIFLLKSEIIVVTLQSEKQLN